MASNFPVCLAGGRQQGYPAIRSFLVNSGQTFIAGALVFLSSNKISECGADPSNILGIALASAANATLYPNSEIPVAILTPDSLVVMGSSTTPAYTDPGTAYGIVKSTNWLVDTSDTSNTRVVVVDYSPHSGNAGQEYWVVRFLAANLQLDAVAS